MEVGLATQQFPVHNVDKETIPDIAPVEVPRQPLKEIEPRVTVDARGSKRGRGHFWARGGCGRQYRPLERSNRYANLEDHMSQPL